MCRYLACVMTYDIYSVRWYTEGREWMIFLSDLILFTIPAPFCFNAGVVQLVRRFKLFAFKGLPNNRTWATNHGKPHQHDRAHPELWSKGWSHHTSAWWADWHQREWSLYGGEYHNEWFNAENPIDQQQVNPTKMPDDTMTSMDDHEPFGWQSSIYAQNQHKAKQSAPYGK